jgi:hypothetical protein
MPTSSGAAALVLGAASVVSTAPVFPSTEWQSGGQRAECEEQRRVLVASSVESAQASGEAASVTERKDDVVVVRYDDYAEFYSCQGTTLEVHFSDPLLQPRKPLPVQR